MKYNRGYVYVVLFETGNLKIGRTTNVKQRLSTLKNQSGSRITKQFITEELENYIEVETKAKKHFKNKNKIGEYYNISFNEAVDYICKLEKIKLTDEEKIKSNKIFDKEFETRQDKLHDVMGINNIENGGNMKEFTIKVDCTSNTNELTNKIREEVIVLIEHIIGEVSNKNSEIHGAVNVEITKP